MTNSNGQFTGWCSVSNTLKSEPIHHISPGRASKDGRFTQALYTCTWIMPSCSNPVICSSENLHLLICTQTHNMLLVDTLYFLIVLMYETYIIHAKVLDLKINQEFREMCKWARVDNSIGYSVPGIVSKLLQIYLI